MTLLTLTWRNLSFYRQAHALVLAGTILASAILVGAMLVGDSIKFSLRQSALRRLGNIHWAMETRGRFFPADLAKRLHIETGTTVTPALLLRGIALEPAAPGMTPRQINDIQILGVQESFWGFAADPKPTPDLTREGIKNGSGAAINVKLAQALHVRCGDQISIRFSKPTLMSKDAPLASREKNDTLRASFIVEAIVPDSQLGGFSLAANQQVPGTVFVSLPWLQKITHLEPQANLILAGPPATSRPDLNQALQKVWQLKDAGLTLRSLDNGRLFQLECDRIFMDPSITSVLSNLHGSVGALTYLVNSIATVKGPPLLATPYSFALALSPSSNATLGLIPPGMPDHEIIINRWLAHHLSATSGDSLRLTYFELNTGNSFVETNRVFKIRRVAEMNEFAPEKDLSPSFPSLTDVEKCAAWDIGIPLNKDLLDDPANEAYWTEYRATPKVIVTLKAGQEMWGNRFGTLTAARFAARENGEISISDALLKYLNPGDFGLVFTAIRQTALKAAEEAMDFGQLFLGMSFFLIIASLMLTRMLYVLGIQHRSEETGLLLAVGFQPKQIRRLWMQEGVFIAATGSSLGTLLGATYTQALIWGLNHPWQGAVASADIQYHSTFNTLASGAFLNFIASMASLILAIRRQTLKSTQDLLSGERLTPPDPTPVPSPRLHPRGKTAGSVWLPLSGVAMALSLIGIASAIERHTTATVFFIAGGLLLVSLLGLIRLLLIRLGQTGGRLTLTTLGLRNAGRQQSRNLTVVSLLACGGFLLLAVAAMQENLDRDAHQRDSGTGGFALFGTSTLPIQADLNSPEERKHFGIAPSADLESTHIVSMKVRDGDDASCLNLNRAQSPTLIGVDPREFARRIAFQSAKDKDHLWRHLSEPLLDGTVPGLAGDGNTAQWGLKKRTGLEDGDILTFPDERGGVFHVKLVGALPMKLSVFQGAVLISARHFAEHYPSENGARMFLIESPPGTERRVQNALGIKLEKWGITITSTTDRLKLFYAVESSYMAMFLVLGGLGMLLSSAGLMIVILRNLRERRDETALLSATGYTRPQIQRIVLTEYGVILGLGLAAGAIASLVAIWPGLQSPGTHLPWGTLSLLAGGMILFQIAWILIATRIALRTPILTALRNP